MSKDQAIKAFQDLIMDIEGQYAGVEPPSGRQPYPEAYDYPGVYYYPYYFGGYYLFYHPYYYFHRRHWR